MRFAQARMNARAVLALMLTALAKQSRVLSRWLARTSNLATGSSPIASAAGCRARPAPRRKTTDSKTFSAKLFSFFMDDFEMCPAADVVSEQPTKRNDCSLAPSFFEVLLARQL